MTRLWIVRAGKHGERELEAIEQGRVILGFMQVDDIGALSDRTAILSRLKELMPDEGENRLRNFAAQLNQFVNAIATGDLVILPRKVTNGVAIGRITGGYEYSSDGP